MPLRLKSALFVDFDNIFIGLKQDDLRAAQEFGRSVRRWLDWIENKMAVPVDDHGNPGVRDILVRRCYGNPETFSDYRGWFTRAGFKVVDCPPLTGTGKNSADIVMVMDILDVLGHDTRFDEFIIMSADADFTPLVQRLRMHDRRTVAIVAGNAAAAYRASCDLVVPDEVFVEQALEVPAGSPPIRSPRPVPAAAVTPRAAPELLDAIAARVYAEASASASGEVAGSRLPAIFREFKEFTPRSNWLGFYTLRALTEALVARRPELRITDQEDWNVAVALPAVAPSQNGGAAGNGAPPVPITNGAAAELRGRIVEVVRGVVAEAREPVVLSRVAHAVVKALGPVVLESHWAGAGTFKQLLERIDDLGLTVTVLPQPGYIFDPARHAAPAVDEGGEGRPENLAGLPDRLVAFIRRISEATGTPRLSPAQYAVLFELIAKEVQKAPYDPNWTPKLVRDQAQERGENISRLSASFVLRGIGFTGYHYRRTGTDEAPALARAFHGNVINLLRTAQVVLTGEELGLLDEWLLSGAAHPAAEPEPLAPTGAAPPLPEPAEASPPPASAADDASDPTPEPEPAAPAPAAELAWSPDWLQADEADDGADELPWLSSDLSAIPEPAPAAEPAPPAVVEAAPPPSASPPAWLFPPFSSGGGRG